MCYAISPNFMRILPPPYCESNSSVNQLFKWLCALCVGHLPLFVMIMAYTLLPVVFDGKGFRDVVTDIPQPVLIALLLCYIASICRWLYWVIFVVVSVVFLGETVCLFNQHSRITSPVMVLALQSNFSESCEFFNAHLWHIVGAGACWGACTSFFIWIGRLWRKRLCPLVVSRLYLNRVAVMSIGVVCALSVFYSPLTLYLAAEEYSLYWQRTYSQMKSASTPVVYWYALKDAVFNPKIESLKILEKTLADMSVDNSDMVTPLTVVYVIGESFSKHKSDIYGYPMPVNPCLLGYHNEGSLIAFDNIVSHSNRTIEVFPALMSTYDVEQPESFLTKPLLPAVFKKAGYGVAYFDNQSLIADARYFDFGCSYFFSKSGIRELSIDEFNKEQCRFDGDFIEKYPVYDAGERNSLTIYHIMGHHVSFDDRFPKEFNRFDAGDYDSIYPYEPGQARVMAYYDNATLYNDFVLDRIISSVKDKCAIVVYAPDHGEEVYDYRDQMGRVINCVEPGTLKVVHEVPLFVWVSDSFMESYPMTVQKLKQNVHKPLYNADISHTIMDLAGIYTEAFDESLSLLRPGGARHDRKTLCFDYDRYRDVIRKVKLRYETD